jgi:hypothetical protein
MSQREGVVNMREVPEETWEEGRLGRREQDLGRAAGSVRVGLRREVILPASSPSRGTLTWPRRRSSLWCGAVGRSSIPSSPNRSAS